MLQEEILESKGIFEYFLPAPKTIDILKTHLNKSKRNIFVHMRLMYDVIATEKNKKLMTFKY